MGNTTVGTWTVLTNIDSVGSTTVPSASIATPHIQDNQKVTCSYPTSSVGSKILLAQYKNTMITATLILLVNVALGWVWFCHMKNRLPRLVGVNDCYVIMHVLLL